MRTGLALLVVAACSAEPRQPSIEDEIRKTYLDQLHILVVHEPVAVARSGTQLLEFERNKEGKWRMELCLPLAEDWEAASTVGFTTYVDETRLRRAYAAYLGLTEGREVPESPMSDRSPLARNIPRRWNLVSLPDRVDSASTGAFGVHCFASEGRYAVLVVSGIEAGQPFDDECFNIEGFPRLVVLRADNGKDWKVYDEGVIPNRGTLGNE